MMPGDKIGWTNENNFLIFACEYVDNDNGLYYRAVQQSNSQFQYPIVNSIISFTTTDEYIDPLKCSVGVDIVPGAFANSFIKHILLCFICCRCCFISSFHAGLLVPGYWELQVYVH